MTIFDKFRMLLLLGWRNIRRGKKRSLLVIAAAMTGMLGVLMNIGLMNGLARMWVEGSIETTLGHVQIRPRGFKKTKKLTARFREPAALEKFLETSRGRFAPKTRLTFRFERPGFVRLGTAVQGALLFGVDPEHEAVVSKFDEWIIRGKYLGKPDQRDEQLGIVPVLLGKANAKKLDVNVGETIVLSLGTKDSSTRSVRARVRGIFQSIAEPIDKRLVLLRRSDLSFLYSGRNSEVSYVLFLGKNRKNADALRRKIQRLMNRDFKDAPVLSPEILTYRDLQPSITVLLEFSDQLLVVMYVLMLSGFAIVLLNSVLMSVFERTREIGIIRALGSSGGLVFSMVVCESLLLGLIGCLLGLALSGGIIGILSQTGLSLAAFAQGMEQMGGAGSLMYPTLRAVDVLTGLYTALLICFLASLYPAWRAVRMSPIQAIYHR